MTDLLGLPLLDDVSINNHLCYLKLIVNDIDPSHNGAYVRLTHRDENSKIFTHRWTRYQTIITTGTISNAGTHATVTLQHMCMPVYGEVSLQFGAPYTERAI